MIRRRITVIEVKDIPVFRKEKLFLLIIMTTGIIMINNADKK